MLKYTHTIVPVKFRTISQFVYGLRCEEHEAGYVPVRQNEPKLAGAMYFFCTSGVPRSLLLGFCCFFFFFDSLVDSIFYLGSDCLCFVFLSLRSGCRMYPVFGSIMSSTQCACSSGDPQPMLVTGCMCPPSSQRHNEGIEQGSDSVG